MPDTFEKSPTQRRGWSWPIWRRRRRYTLLMAGLLMHFLLFGLEPGWTRSTLLWFGFLFVFGACTIAMVGSRRITRLFLALASLALLLSLSNQLQHEGVLPISLRSTLAICAITVCFLYFGGVMVAILHDVLGSKDPDPDKVWGALCVYLLFGFSCALVYTLIEYMKPGSFDLGDGAINQPGFGLWPHNFSVFFYFSFVTLSTVGYGDIVPVEKLPRNLAALQAITGQIFLAVMVAGLVATHMGRLRRDPPSS